MVNRPAPRHRLGILDLASRQCYVAGAHEPVPCSFYGNKTPVCTREELPRFLDAATVDDS